MRAVLEYRMWALGLLLAVAMLLTVPAEAEANRWEPAIAAFEEQDRESPPPRNAVLFVGSSSILMWDLAASFEGLEAINRGFGGSDIADSTHFFDRIVRPYDPRVVVLYAGDNDISRGKSAEDVEADFGAFAGRMRAHLPEAKLFFIAIKPSIARWELWPVMRDANARIEALTEEDARLVFVDTATPMLGEDGRPKAELLAGDGLHLSEAGYALWTSILKPYLDDAEPEAP